MKNILLSLLTCVIFYKTERVLYDVPEFYKLACSGVGIVKDKIYNNEYIIITPQSEVDCPKTFEVSCKRMKKI